MMTTWCRQCEAENPTNEHLDEHGGCEYRMVPVAYGHATVACRYCGINHGLPQYLLSLMAQMRAARQPMDSPI